MAVVQCEKGHYYDNEKYPECPHCQEAAGDNRNSQDAQPVTMALAQEEVENIALAYVKHQSGQHVQMDDERTIGIYAAHGNRQKVVGWLVCTEGAEEGGDYPLHKGFNRLGRGFENDIVIKEDLGVTREEHCSIVYEERKNNFYLVPKAGNITYLDGKMIESSTPLTDRQEIVVGQTTLRFVAFCMGEWKWNT